MTLTPWRLDPAGCVREIKPFIEEGRAHASFPSGEHPSRRRNGLARGIGARRFSAAAILTFIHAALADERSRLAEQFDNGGDQEVAAELDEIHALWRLGDDEP